MQVTFLGGVEEVGRLGCVIETTTATLLMDYGMAPSRPPRFPQPAPALDDLLLTHAHLDHSGCVPQVAAQRDCPILATDPTLEVAEMLAHDSQKIAREEGHKLPFTPGDVKQMLHQHVPVIPRRWRDLEGTAMRPHPAGHIPGAMSYELEDGHSTLLFSGDVGGLQPMRLVKPPRLPICDTLLLEATYSGREHPPRQQLERDFLEKVESIITEGGRALVPAFAVGRTQELMLILAELDVTVWVDGMGRKLIPLFLDHPRSLRSATKLKEASRRVKVIRNRQMRDTAMERPGVILTTSGMLDGGPVLHYLHKLHQDPHTELLLTGYQVEGTNGHRLMETGRVEIEGVEVKVRCPVSWFDFSAHAGHSELVTLARQTQAQRVVLYHSDDRGPLAQSLEEEGFEVLLPLTGQTIEL